jgi:nitrite reductase/ring-hydroxylating ferredoxin subunit
MITYIPDEVRERALAEGITSYSTPSGASYLVVHQAGTWRVYVNLCPHRRLRLDRAGQLYRSADGSLLVCANHGAKFHLLTGKCVAGPCVGKYLQPVPDLEAE